MYMYIYIYIYVRIIVDASVLRRRVLRSMTFPETNAGGEDQHEPWFTYMFFAQAFCLKTRQCFCTLLPVPTPPTR